MGGCQCISVTFLLWRPQKPVVEPVAILMCAAGFMAVAVWVLLDSAFTNIAGSGGLSAGQAQAEMQPPGVLECLRGETAPCDILLRQH